MKKVYIVIAAIVIIAGGVAVYLLFAKPGTVNNPLSLANSAFVSSPDISACDIATENIAKDLLGKDISKSDNALSSASTDDIAVSICSYSTKISASSTSSIPKISGINILARIAKTQDGANSNAQQFQNKPQGTENVTKIGDSAYYNPQFRQLNVLKAGNWYVVSYYIDSLTNASLATDKQLAEKLQFQ